MNYEQAVFDYLSTPENFPIAFEVAEFVEKLKTNLHASFWPAYTNKLIQLLEASSYLNSWKVIPLGETEYFKNFAKSYISPMREEHPEKLTLQIALGQGNPQNNYRFYKGVCWNRMPDYIPSNPKLDDLSQMLKERDLTFSDKLWPGWNYFNHHARGVDFLLRMANEPEVIVEEIVQGTWQLFLDLVPLLDVLNMASMNEA